MAALAGTVLENAVMMATDRLMAFENRRPDLGVTEAYDKYTNLLISESKIKSLRASARRPLDIVVLNRQDATIRNQRRINITPDGSNSAKMNLNWKTYTFDVGTTASINADNHISQAEDLSHQLESAFRTLLKQIDFDQSGLLELGKYSALPPSSLMPVVGGAYKSTQKDIYFDTPAVMRGLELEGPYHALSNVEAIASRTRMSTLGANNAQNLEKLLAGYEFGYSKNLSAGTSAEVYYFVPTGSLGMVSWVEFDARQGTGSYDAGHKYDVITLEFTSLSGYTFSMDFGVRYVGEAQDKSAVLPGLERAYTDAWAFAVDVSSFKAYSSEAGKSPIIKILADKTEGGAAAQG